MARTHRTTWGAYRTTDGRFEIAQAYEGDGDRPYGWHLFEVDADGERGEWCNTFATKRDALDAVERISAT